MLITLISAKYWQRKIAAYEMRLGPMQDVLPNTDQYLACPFGGSAMSTFAKALADEIFTAKSDYKYSSSGWVLEVGKTVLAKSGDDVILGESRDYREEGILNFGTVDAGNGNDLISGIGDYAPSGTGIGISNFWWILGGNGNDRIYGEGFDLGIYNTSLGVIDGGNGDDTIEGFGSGGQGQEGIVNGGKILGGKGNDHIKGSGLDWGIENHNLIDAGLGDDIIYGESLVTPSTQTSIGIVNGGDGIINTGSGNDTLTGAGRDFGVYNNGLISFGHGDDLIDGGNSGFGGQGVVDMGDGDDTVKGFGTGSFNGGLGIDNLIFNTGLYTVEALGGESYLIGGIMTVSGFENFGSSGSAQSFDDAVVVGFVSFG